MQIMSISCHGQRTVLISTLLTTIRSILQEKWKEECFRYGKELLKELKVEWENVTLAYLDQLVEVLPRHIDATIKEKSEAIKY